MEYTAEDVAALYPRVLTRYSGIVVDHGLGCRVWDVQGRSWLDFTSGIAVTSTGHCHRRVVEAIKQQAEKIIHAQANIFGNPAVLELSSRLIELLPPPLDQVMFSNSGSEAVEGAIKLARSFTGRPAVVAFRGGFHGRTAGAMAVTSSRVRVRGGFEPLPASVYMAPYPYAFRSPWRGDPEGYSEWCLEQLRELFETLVRARDVAAAVIEPVLGEGGYVPAPKSFLAGLRALTEEHGILLVIDEVQSGFGRTGSLFACEQYGVKPDIMIMAKGIASGLPLSAIASRRDIFDSWEPGQHGGTFGGNPIAAAAAIATLDVIQSEHLLENARARGSQLVQGLRELADRHSRVVDIRGLGLMIGVEFKDEVASPAGEFVIEVIARAEARGLLLLSAGTYGQVIRLAPPLVLDKAEASEGVAILEAAISDVESERR